MIKKTIIVTLSLFALLVFQAFAEEEGGFVQPPEPADPPPTDRLRPDQLETIIENLKKEDPRPSINADTAAELAGAGIDGLTAAVAEKIVNYRAKIGYYRFVEQIVEAGVSRETYNKIKDKVSLRGEIVIHRDGETE